MNLTVPSPAQPPTGFSRPGSTVAFLPLTRCTSMQAFTLVEVTFALGIISFAFVAMFGMIPVGLKTARKAMEASTGSQIVQRIVTQVKQTDFSALNENEMDASNNFSFDDQANKVATNDALKIYEARVKVTKGVTLPGCAANTSLARVKIEVVNNPGNRANAFDGSISKKVYSAYVARSGS